MLIRALSTAGDRIAGTTGLGVFRIFVQFQCQSDGSHVHTHCGRNRADTVSVPHEYQVIGSPALPSILPYYHLSGVPVPRHGA